MPGNPAGSAGGVMVCHHPVRLASAAATVVCPDRPVRLGTSALGWRRRARERPVLAVLWWPCLTAPSCAIVTSSTSIFTSTDFVVALDAVFTITCGCIVALETMLPLPISEVWIWENMLDFRLLDLIAELIVACEPPPTRGPGHPRRALVRVIATLRRFLREGLPWRSLRATIEQVSGSTLRRFLAYWAENAVLAKVHALLVAMLRGNPALILDSCSVRAKRGGDLVGPNPTDALFLARCRADGRSTVLLTCSRLLGRREIACLII